MRPTQLLLTKTNRLVARFSLSNVQSPQLHLVSYLPVEKISSLNYAKLKFPNCLGEEGNGVGQRIKGGVVGQKGEGVGQRGGSGGLECLRQKLKNPIDL